MSDLAIPFSLSDILERVVPGGLVISAVAVGFYDQFREYTQIASPPLAYAAFLAGSYALGVAVNSLAGFIRIKGYRRYWSDNPSAMESAVRSSIETHFRLAADDQTWRICYGTVVKQGYGANTQLFLGLEVFCRAMTVASLLAVTVFLGAAGVAFAESFSAMSYLAFAAAASALTFLFHQGARIYSQAFVGSIYEGFFNWWCDARNASPADTTSKTEQPLGRST